MAALELFSLSPVETKLDNGKTVYLRRITARERAEWLKKTETKDGDTINWDNSLEVTVYLLARSLCNERGERLFSDSDAETLKEIDNATVDLLFTEIMAINFPTRDDVKKK